jgi:tetratricopeptide (TPR) repeat protein
MEFGKIRSSSARACARGRIRQFSIFAFIFLVCASFPTEALSSGDRSLARSFFASAQEAWKARNHALALEKLKLAVKADSNYADAFLLMGLIEFQQGDIASSVQHYKSAIALEPSSYSARYNLALAYLREHRLQDGKLELEQALKIDPHQADAEYDLGLVLLELGDPLAAVAHLKNSRVLNARKPDVSFNIVRAYLEAGKVSMARSEADAAVRQLAGDVQWNVGIGQLFLKNGQPKEAVNYLQRAVVARPEDYAIRRQLAVAYLAARDPQPVLDLIEHPTTAEGHYLRGSAYYLIQSYQEAASESEKALLMEPDNLQALTLRIRLLQRAGEQATALGLANKAIALSPEWDEPYYLSGVSLFYIRHYSEASDRLARAVELNDRSARAHFLHGITLASQEKISEAEQAMKRAVALQPGNARFRCHLGILLMRKNDPSAAEQLFRQAVELAPRYALSHYQLGKLLARSDRFRAAVNEFEQAVELDPTLGSAYYQLSRMYARLGDKEKSSRALVEFQKLYQEQNSNESQDLTKDAGREAELSELP